MSSEPRTISFLNNSGEVMTAHAVFRGTEMTSGAIQAVKPNGDGSTGVWYVNAPEKVANGGYGACTKESPVWVLYDDADAVVNGDEWGPQAGSWELKKGNAGFIAVGGASGGRALFDFRRVTATTVTELTFDQIFSIDQFSAKDLNYFRSAFGFPATIETAFARFTGGTGVTFPSGSQLVVAFVRDAVAEQYNGVSTFTPADNYTTYFDFCGVLETFDIATLVWGALPSQQTFTRFYWYAPTLGNNPKIGMNIAAHHLSTNQVFYGLRLWQPSTGGGPAPTPLGGNLYWRFATATTTFKAFKIAAP